MSAGPWNQGLAQKQSVALSSDEEGGAGDGIRTRDILLGKQTLCQLSYSRPGVRSTPADNRFIDLLKANRTAPRAYSW